MKKAISIIMCLMLVFSSLTFVGISVSAETSGDFEYSVLEDGTVGITKYTGFAAELEIPSTIDGKAVTSIDDRAFSGCASLISLNIPYGVINISFHSFSGCTSLITVNIPDSVIIIGNYAFSGCTALKNVNIPNNVTGIGSSAFERCESLTSVTIPNSVESIGGNAFSRCTALTSINVDVNNENYCDIDGALYNKDITKLMQYPAGNTRTAYTIPNTVTSIYGYAFSGCTALASITIPDSVERIGGWTFSNCTSLKNVTIPDSVKSIDGGAFSGCTALTSISIPNNVKSIDFHAFSGCTALTSVTISDSVEIIDSYAFSGCTALTSIIIPNSVESIELRAFSDCTALTSVTIPDSVTSVDSYAFSGCTSLKSVTIPDSVTGIDSYAFYDCTALTSITIPESVTSIGFNAFGFYWDSSKGEDIKVESFTIRGCKNSEAERYANDNDINFIDLKDHTHSHTPKTTKQPTCTQKGVRTYICICGESYTEDISALGHKEAADKAVAPTCTKQGLTAGKHCSVCGEILVKQKSIPTKAHSYKWVVTKKASYVSNGIKSYKCSLCGRVLKTASIAKLKLKTPTFSVSAGKKLFKVKYTKVTGATGFQVKYTIGKKTVTKTFNQAKSVTKTISGLKKGKYSVQIRAFTKQGSKTVYSNWTNAKTVKVK